MSEFVSQKFKENGFPSKAVAQEEEEEEEWINRFKLSTEFFFVSSSS